MSPVITMAPAACPSLHELEGVCEYCGEVCDSTQDELNAIACTFEGCPSPTIYHQHCIETYLKTIRLDKQRKTGFQCPRGCGKGSKSDKPCPGRVTKSHPIHARNDSSKKRRKAKMPEAAPPTVVPLTPVKKEKEEKSQHLNKSKSVKIEKDKDKEDQSEWKSVPKPLVLNRASTFPSLSGNKATPSDSVSVNCSSSHTSTGVPKSLSRESTVAAIAAARSEIAASKRGGTVKNNSETYVGGRSDQSITSYDSRSNQTSDSDDDSTRQSSKDFRKLLSVGRGGVEAVPVVNAWALGRSCNELLNGFKLVSLILNEGDMAYFVNVNHKQKDVMLPTPQIGPLNSAQDSKVLNPSMTVARPPIIGRSDHVGLPVGEEDDLEVRRLKARTKNEKKHLQRAARAREKREAEEAAAALAVSSTSTTVKEKESHFTQPETETMFRRWSESFTNALWEWKFLSLTKQLQEYGFAEWQANMAIHMCGSDAEGCLDWLLENRPTTETNLSVQHKLKMDISKEVKMLEEVMLLEGFTQEQVEVATLSTSGDIEAALKHLRSSNLQWKSSQLESKESSQSMYSTAVSPQPSFGQASSQCSSDLATGVWDSMLNGTSDGQELSPLCDSVNGSDSQRSFGPFVGGFVSDLSRYNSLLGVDDPQHAYSGSNRPISGPFSSGDQGQSNLFWTNTSQGNIGYHEAFPGGLQSSCELTASTVTSVAAAVLNDTFGLDEQMISRLTEVIAVNEAPLNSTVNALASLKGMWSYQPSPTFSKFPASKGFPNVSFYTETDSLPYTLSNKTLDGQAFLDTRLGAFGEGPTAGLPGPAQKTTRMNGYGHTGSLGMSRWEDHAVKLVDDAEEQELLMSELLSQLLV